MKALYLAYAAFNMALKVGAIGCCYDQLLTFEGEEGVTPLATFFARNVESKGVGFSSVGLATIPNSANAFIKCRSGSSCVYYALNSGLTTIGKPLLSIAYDDTDLRFIEIDKYFGGCTLLLVNPPAIPIPALGIRCAVTFTAYSGTDSNGFKKVGAQTFTFRLEQSGIQHPLVERVIDKSLFTTTLWERVFFTTSLQIQVNGEWKDINSFVGLPGLPNAVVPSNAQAGVFFDDFKVRVYPKSCGTNCLSSAT